MHALTLLQASIADSDGTQQWIFAIGSVGTEIDDDRRMRRRASALQVDRGERQRAGNAAKLVMHEQTADIVLL